MGLAGSLILALAGLPAVAEPVHAIAMHGAPAYAADFDHFDYVNPYAPKGGTLVLAAEQGSFDSLNPFILKGQAADGWRHVFEPLAKRSQDEPFSLYGLLAESIEVDPERHWIRFTLRPEARFADGEPVTADVVRWSWETLRDRGRPNHRLYYRQVDSAEVEGRSVTFRFSGDNRELPLLMALMPVLPRHWFADRDFEATGLTPFPGSGPYAVAEVRPGQSVSYVRRPDYWGRDLAVNRGDNNFDRITYEYFRDQTAKFEALKGGLYDVRFEEDPGRWAESYDFPAMQDGRMQRLELPLKRPVGMRGLVFNTRRAIFADRAVRAALANALDFDWINRTLFHGAYARNESWFQNSDLAASGEPAPAELALLEPYRDSLPAEAFGVPVPVPDSPDRNAFRSNLRQAQRALQAAGWTVGQDRKLRDATGRAMAFEILLYDPTDEKVALEFARGLERLGITATTRLVDPAQYERRRQDFDYDMIVNHWYQSLSPGSEQWYYFGAAAADQPASRNYAGVKSPAVDALVGALTAARTRDDLRAAARALDRVLRAGHYVVPLYWQPTERLAVRAGLGRPETVPTYGPVLTTWWWKP
ncbi:MAG: extracellular solute-binding protein [Pseudomonadota bacterium]|nr:extracellular solute-binding protein [Pseudomonadota bacterium]